MTVRRSAAALLALATVAGPPADAGAQAPRDSARIAGARPPRPAPAPPRPPDPWLGGDKLRHFALSGMVQGVGFGAATAAGVRGRPALIAASVATTAVAVGKEWRDRRRGGRFSVRDLAWDAVGGALWGVLVARSGR